MTTHQAVQELIQTAFLFNGGVGQAGGYVLRPRRAVRFMCLICGEGSKVWTEQFGNASEEWTN